MKRRTNKERLQDILDSTRIIATYISSTGEEKFARDRLCQDAVLRRIEIIGEAARNVSLKFQQQHPKIPWRQMIHAQHKIVREHFKIDAPTLWNTAQNGIPQLEKAISKLLKEL